ncbi:phosphoribosylaminoimidazolesuccinocarboxamide synthase [Gryllotalpicola reticulitermitis]|uniref:Phosphoribosylaminoimidazole-succinocarboxamide synthase n=1 Tax=Gryllotalpicola reticulitermitis TaxID=1184153 RepID=A0ABV8Q8E4_9MICO
MTAQELPGWTHLYSGKVRDLYVPEGMTSGDAPELLVVASDRVSAFDFVLSPGIPRKGELLTQLSNWWFAHLDVPNHLVSGGAARVPAEVAGRAAVVKPLEMFAIECVVRGYLTGSGWAEYQQSQSVTGIPLPAGLHNGDRLPEPIFTPAWKAPQGEHDENISFDRMIEIVGEEAALALRELSLTIYTDAAATAEAHGLIIADTKFEFGRDGESGEIVLADEVLTSDSSRYWDLATWSAGTTPEERMASFDKQIVRDWLAANWDKQGTPPELPADIVAQTASRYAELIARLTA